MKCDKYALLSLIKQDCVPALGCTEPIAVSYCASFIREYIKEEPQRLEITVSKSLFKNGKSVTIPKTGKCGLDLAGALGIFAGDRSKGLLVLSEISEDDVKRAEKFVDEGRVKLSYAEDGPDVYAKVDAYYKDKYASSILRKSHTNVEEVYMGENLVYSAVKDEVKEESFDIKDMTLKELRKLALATDSDDLDFVKKGIEMNMRAAKEGLASKNGLNLGTALEELKKLNILSNDPYTMTRIMTAGAADMRMSGGNCPIMTSGGSGNQGINVVLPIYIVAKDKNIDEEMMIKSVYFGHIVNRYVKNYSGKLSGMCGCAIAAGIGAAAGIAMMLGGDDRAVEGSCSNMLANLTGVICDGAKDTCALKLSTCAGEAVLSAFMALNGTVVRPDIGVVGSDIEDTIKNIGKLCQGAFKKVDEVMLEIIGD